MDHKKSNIENKLFTFITIFTILSLCIIPFIGTATATPVYIAVNQPASLQYGTNYKMLTAHPSGTTAVSADSQSFIVENEGYLTSITITLKKTGSPTGTISMTVTNTTLGSGHYYPNEFIKGTSTTTWDIEDLTTTAAQYSFAFNQTLLLEEDGNYAFYVYVVSADSMDSSNYVTMACSTTNTYQESGDYTYGIYKSSAFVSTVYDAWFTIIGDTDEADPEATPTPTPTADPAATATPNPQFTQIWDTLASLINLLVPLLCVILPAFFGYKFAGAWGFMAGVNIGAILAYTILGSTVFPLWGIVALLIIDALLLFGKVGLHE